MKGRRCAESDAGESKDWVADAGKAEAVGPYVLDEEAACYSQSFHPTTSPRLEDYHTHRCTAISLMRREALVTLRPGRKARYGC